MLWLSLSLRNRRRLRRVFRYELVDVLVIVAVSMVTMTALMRWPDKYIADGALPGAFLIAYIVWRIR